MEYVNNHYVPQLIIRRYNNKINLYNIESKVLELNKDQHQVFSYQNFYSEELEKLFNKIENQFANILNNNILKNDSISLKRRNIWTIKKFLLLQMYRVRTSKQSIEEEIKLGKLYKETQPEVYNFEEKIIENESIEQRWERNLKLFIDCDNATQLSKNEMKTYEALYWINVFNVSYLAFWDNTDTCEDFVLTDIGMASENEIGWNELQPYNIKKVFYLDNLIKKTINNDEHKNILINLLFRQSYFHENFMVFPISKNRIIALINPFYKLYSHNIVSKNEFKVTMIDDMQIFEENKARYKEKTLKEKTFMENDDFIYKVHKLNLKDTIYINSLMLDRTQKYLGIADLSKIRKTLHFYNKHKFKRVDYSELVTQIENTI